ncbi:thioesterase family protein [Massilibacteroides sp.]|uniref:acyl-CoA thioesterase n=1 Tax=Massilibacteroides sp. TaxID=2034766 RepID=UPI002618FBE2|nr:thioesterase family protein [Massilibacteroides sp.]MDD4515160.1 thioesterase family protein [Massilibacteroides sp.]
MTEVAFKHTIPLQLRFNDVDKFGHINNAVYLTYYDLGKTNYFESVCPNVNWDTDAIVVVHIDVDFMVQIFSTDHVSVQTSVTKIGTKSFELTQRIVDSKTAEVKCLCRSVMVTYDLVKHQTIPMRKEWIDAICAYEGRDLRTQK